jgi:hydrogenase maturation protein HypF
MRLEAAACNGRPQTIETRLIEDAGMIRFDTVSLFRELVDMSRSVSVCDVAATAQEAVAQGTAALAMRVAREQGISSIVLSGGCAYNHHIASRVRECCEENGFRFFTNGLVPCGDGGVCLGQAAMAGLGVRMVDG